MRTVRSTCTSGRKLPQGRKTTGADHPRQGLEYAAEALWPVTALVRHRRGGQERLNFKSNERSDSCEKLVDAKGDKTESC